MKEISSHNVFWDRISERADETITAFRKGEVPQVIRYAVHVTSACNMRCKYCRETKRGKMIPEWFFDNLCRKVTEKGIVHITGGEPMLVPWLEDSIEKFNSVRFALNSNALILPKDNTLRDIFRFKTSLDDYYADRWNEIVGGDFFNKVVEHIKIISNIVQYTSVCYTATHQNAIRLGNFIDFCFGEFPRLYSLSVSFYKGEDDRLILTQKDIDDLFLASEKMPERSKQLFVETHSHKGNYFPQNTEIPCYLSLTERLYDENMTEYYCSHLYRDKVVPPGNPGKDEHCVTGCNKRFSTYNYYVHERI